MRASLTGGLAASSGWIADQQHARRLRDARARATHEIGGHGDDVPGCTARRSAPTGALPKAASEFVFDVAHRHDEHVGIAADDLLHRDVRPESARVGEDRSPTRERDQLADERLRSRGHRRIGVDDVQHAGVGRPATARRTLRARVAPTSRRPSPPSRLAVMRPSARCRGRCRSCPRSSERTPGRRAP